MWLATLTSRHPCLLECTWKRNSHHGPMLETPVTGFAVSQLSTQMATLFPAPNCWMSPDHYCTITQAAKGGSNGCGENWPSLVSAAKMFNLAVHWIQAEISWADERCGELICVSLHDQNTAFWRFVSLQLAHKFTTCGVWAGVIWRRFKFYIVVWLYISEKQWAKHSVCLKNTLFINTVYVSFITLLFFATLRTKSMDC